jgi:3-(3-hydroxy-phenyl)propionate hydroxylase
MLVQPDVENASGHRRKLDDVLGPWFAIIGWQVDPQAGLDDDGRAFWRRLGARFVQIDRARSGGRQGARRPSALGTDCVEDVDNQFADWIAAHPCQVVVLRPDRYVAAQSDLASLAAVTQRFRSFTPDALIAQREAA